LVGMEFLSGKWQIIHPLWDFTGPCKNFFVLRS